MADPIRCGACGAPLKAKDLDARRGLATCHACGNVLKLDGLGGDAGGDAGRRDDRPPPERAPRPEGWEEETRGGVTAVRWRWFRGKYVAIAVFCVPWFAFLFGWYAMLLGDGPGGGFGLVFVLFPLIHVAAGLALAYTALCGFVNRTTVTAGRGAVKVEHAPLPWPGSKTHALPDAAAVAAKMKINQGKDSTSITWDVLAETADGGRVTLLKRLEEQDEARYLARVIGGALGVPWRGWGGGP